MRLSKLGASFGDRLSFLRVLTRRMAQDRAAPRQILWTIDAAGFGRAAYTITYCGHTYTLVAVSTPLAPEARSDRVIAEAWDASFVLYDGIPSAAEVDRIAATAPRQEAARFTEKDLVLSRANRSGRLFDAVVQALRQGRQPDPFSIIGIGYLMRTTAVYGNGKFGIADRSVIDDRPGMADAFAAEMLTVWLIRHFTHDLVEFLGRGQLDPALKRQLGIGNATGLGMAPFLVTHPVLLNNWMLGRETALARARPLALDKPALDRAQTFAQRAARHLDQWSVDASDAMAEIETLRAEWQSFVAMLDHTTADRATLGALVEGVQNTSAGMQELVASLVIELAGDAVDGLADCMADPFGPVPDPLGTTGTVRKAIEDRFGWALALDFDDTVETARFWYVSANKSEPRIGLRHDEPGADLESPLDIARRIRSLYDALPDHADTRAFVENHPEHALALSRVGISARYPYAEIQDNLIAASCRPIDLLRAKLARFGATKFDPKSDLWTRVTLAQGAPLAEDIARGDGDDWWMAAWQP